MSIRYSLVAMCGSERLTTCGHKHRTKIAAVACRWMPPPSQPYTSITIGQADPSEEKLVGRPRNVGMGRDRGAVSVSQKMGDRIALAAEDRNQSMAQLVEEAVEPELKAWEEQQQAARRGSSAPVTR